MWCFTKIFLIQETSTLKIVKRTRFVITSFGENFQFLALNQYLRNEELLDGGLCLRFQVIPRTLCWGERLHCPSHHKTPPFVI